MITPGNLPLTVQRWSPFDYSIQLPVGIDFTGAAATMQARLRDDAPGAAVILLVMATAGLEGLSFTHVTTDSIVTSTLRIRINKATAQAVLLNAGKAPTVDVRQDARLSYDIQITGGGYELTRWYEGVLTIRGGSTQ